VQLTEVSKRYGHGNPVLADVNLAVWPADVLAVTGANGSGKSTLLRLLARLSLPSSGQIRNTAQVIGYVPERFPSHEWLSAAAYLRHLGRIRGLPSAAAARRVDDLLDALKLADNRAVAMRKLSKGNAQKVALAQAVLTTPDLLVLDEPWSGLDASVHDALHDLLCGTAAGGAAVIFTDHREAVVGATATRVATIDGGRLSEAGPPASRPAAAQAPGGVMRACFAAAAGRTPLPAHLDWRALPGVLDVRQGTGQVEVLVTRQAHDALLVRAIEAGWSVSAVQPAASPAAPTPGEPG
jgi:ABC-type multidrug transport system ATPase subunit